MSENASESIQTRRPDGTHRVVITGVGAVTPAGVGVEALWETLMERGCCIAPIERFDTSEYEVHIAGEVRDFDGVEHGLTKKEARRFERFVQYAIVAADEALAQSGLEVTDENRDRIAVVFGTGIGGIDELQKSFATLEEKGPKRVNPLFIPTMIGNIAAGNLAIRYGMRGECLNVVTACATGAHCIGTALRDIRHGYIDAALVGGTEESVSPICIAGFTNLSALTRAEDPKEASLPFDARRGGFVAGEGGGPGHRVVGKRARPRGRAHRRDHRLRQHGRRLSHDRARPGGHRDHGRHGRRSGRGRLHPGRSGAPERPRHGHAGQRRHGVEGARESHGRRCAGRAAGYVHQGHHGPHARGRRCRGGHRVRPVRGPRRGAPTAGFAEAAEDCPVAVVTEAVTDYPQKVALSTSLGFGGHNAALAFSPYKG